MNRRPPRQRSHINRRAPRYLATRTRWTRTRSSSFLWSREGQAWSETRRYLAWLAKMLATVVRTSGGRVRQLRHAAGPSASAAGAWSRRLFVRLLVGASAEGSTYLDSYEASQYGTRLFLTIWLPLALFWFMWLDSGTAGFSRGHVVKYVVLALIWACLAWWLLGLYNDLAFFYPRQLGWFNNRPGVLSVIGALVLFLLVWSRHPQFLSIGFAIAACVVSGVGAYCFVGPLPRPFLQDDLSLAEAEALRHEADVLRSLLTVAVQFVAVLVVTCFLGVVLVRTDQGAGRVDVQQEGLTVLVLAVGVCFGIVRPLMARIALIQEELLQGT